MTAAAPSSSSNRSTTQETYHYKVVRQFAVMTVIFSVIGLVIAAALRRFAHHPRTAWIRTTVVLTVLSFVPDALADAAVATKLLLMLTHVAAAAIVIPAIGRRLS